MAIKDKDKDKIFEYDEVPYSCFSLPQTHPNRLATLATLLGMTPAPIQQCRVLELGCGTGGNLVPMAHGLPQSEFIGIDLSAHEIKQAKNYAAGLQLQNITFNHANILDVDASYGKFDYIIAHGVYSWVPEAVRKKVLDIYRNNLQPNGIAYVSYNVYPGWHFYNMAREMMRYHVRNIKNPPDAINAAKEFLKQLIEAAPEREICYKMVLQQERDILLKVRHDDLIWHDMLAAINNPFYFNEFIETIKKEELQYLADADFHSMIPNGFSPAALALLQSANTDDVIVLEQYMDFVRNRSFRETLVCHASIPLNRDIDTNLFLSFYYLTTLKPVASVLDIKSDKKEDFRDLAGNIFSADNFIVKALLSYLSSRSPQQVNFSDILAGIQALFGKDQQTSKAMEALKEQLLEHLWWCYSKGLILLYMQPSPVSVQCSERPVASLTARYEVKQQCMITNHIHERIEIDNFTRHVLTLLDGEHDRDAIVASLAQLVSSGKITIEESGKPVMEQARINDLLRQRLEIILKQCANLGLLIN